MRYCNFVKMGHEFAQKRVPKGEYAVLVDLGTGVTAEFEYELVEFSV